MLLSAGTMTGNEVVNGAEESLGSIDKIMIDTDTGEVGYAVLASGGVLGMGEKLFAIPWDALRLDTVEKRFVLDVPKERFEEAPGFDRDNWPDTASAEWRKTVGSYWEPDRSRRAS